MQQRKPSPSNIKKPIEARKLLETSARKSVDNMDLGGVALRQRVVSVATGNMLNHRAPQPEESSELTPVLIGDYIVLQDLNIESPGFVSGDPAFKRCGVQKLPNKNKKPLEYDDYVFQVFPSLIYRSREEQRKKNSSSRSSSRSTITSRPSFNAGDVAEREHEDKLLHDRIEHEDKLNEAMMQEVTNGTRREPLRYGQLIQLYHLKSGLFISCHHTAALKDASCRKVSLREGSVSAQFELIPCFKAQTEGSIVYYSHSVKLGSVKLNGSMFLHTSNAVYEDILDSESSTLPLCLRTHQTLELNASSKFTTYLIRKYGSFKPNSQDSLKTSFSPFRLYHSQSESFIIASCNKDKNDQSLSERVSSFKSNDVRNSLRLPGHIPYLRAVNQITSSEEPDPTDPRNHMSKAVWVFESATRSSAATVQWGVDVRIRHVPSGRYLCVDPTSPFHSLPSENWYRTYLVIDSTDDPTLLSDTYNYCIPEAAIFRVESEGGLGETIPKNISHARIEFWFELRGISLHLFLHNADVEKPYPEGSKKSSLDRSRLLVFTTQRSAQDTVKVMPISEEEARSTFQANAFIPIIMAFAERVADKSHALPTNDKLQDIMIALINIINFQSKSAHESTSTDWIKKANSMLPSAFSTLFEGEPNELAQRISRDLKLLDAVFTMTLAPYQRLPNPFDGKEKEKMWGCAGIQKLAQVALQRMFVLNTESQLYFRRNSVLSRPMLRGSPAEHGTWMDLVKLQLEDPLGSAVSLSKLLSSNGDLLREYATPSMVDEFARMIRELGPQPRLVNFFESICTSGNMPVKSNQEMILRLAWRLPEERSKLFVEMKAVNITRVRSLHDVARLPNGDLKTDTTIAPLPKEVPSDYLGRAVQEAGLDPVFVHWSGHTRWTAGMSQSLFHSPSEMTGPKGLEMVAHDGESLVRVEDFCWVLEPERLCYPVTGESWSNFDSARENDENVRNRFARQEQLVSYFVAQINMLSRLCFGRSYNCIRMLQESFPYTMLVSVVRNEHLPCMVRAVMLNLARVIYVDRFPQMLNCARPSIPEVLWVFQEEGMDPEDMAASPVIQAIALRGSKSGMAFPKFQISKSHKFFGASDSLYSFPDHHKYYLLTSSLNDILDSFGSGRIDHNNKSMNALATQTVTALSNLLSFGFLSSYDQMQSLVTSLVRLLDGRRDVMCVSFHDDQESDPFEEGFTPSKQRFELTSNSTSVTALKSAVLDVLLSVSDFRCQFRLGKLLHIFKEYKMEKKQCKELKVFHEFMVKLEEKSYDGFLTAQLFQQFEDLFITGDGKLLDFEEMSGQPLMTILLDCLMYKDDAVHSKALELLERTYTQRAQLLQAVEDVILLDKAPYYPQLNANINYFVLLLRSTEVWAVSSKISGEFDEQKRTDFYEMVDSLNRYLHYKLDKTGGIARKSMMKNLIPKNMPNLTKTISGLPGIQMTNFGVNSSPTTGPKSPRSSLSPVASFHDLRHHEPVKEHQDMLRAMNVQFALTMALAIDYNLAFKGSICSPEEKIKSRDIHIDVLRNVVQILQDFVVGNEKNQDTIFETALPYLLQHMGSLELPPLPADFPTNPKIAMKLVTEPGLNTEAVIIECLRGNSKQCEEVPLALFDKFGELLNKVTDCSESHLLDFFDIAILPDPSMDALFRNQESTLDQLVASRHENTLSRVHGCFGINNKPLPSKPHMIVSLLSRCIENVNAMTAAKLQAHGVTIDATFEALVNKVYKSISSKTSDKPPTSPRHESKTERHARENKFLNDEHFTSMVVFLNHQLLSLVIDPRMYQREEMWRVVCEGVAVLVSSFATNLDACVSSGEQADLIRLTSLVLPSIRIVHEFVKGATQMGADDMMNLFENTLRGNHIDFPHSVFATLLRIREHLDHADRVKKRCFPAEVELVEEKLLVAARSLQYFLVPDSQLDEEAVDVMLHKDDDNQSLVHNPALSPRVSSLDKLAPSFMTSNTDAPDVYLSYFVEALKSNPKINQRLLARKFEFLNVLESVEARTRVASDKKTTDPSSMANKFMGSAIEHVIDHVVHLGGDDGKFDQPNYGVRIQWPMIVVRLVDYLRMHNFDSESNLIRVHNVLRNHVLKARSVEANSHVLDSSEMDFDDIEKFREVQNKLDNAGVTDVALLAIATHTPGARDTAAVSAIELLRELLFSGNKNVQASVLHYIEHVDKDARFLKHIRARLTESSHYIKERNDQVRSAYAPMQREHQLEYGEADQTLQLLTEMLEGHNYSVQNIIRAQPLQSADVDLIKQVFDLLHLQAGQPHLLKRMGDPSVDLLISTLVFIVECMQGPCDGNQRAFVKSESTITSVKNVLESPFNPRIESHVVMKVKCRAILIFAAALEGRKDKVVHDVLVQHIEPSILHQFAVDTTEFIRIANDGKEEWSKDIPFRKKVMNEALQGLVALANTRTEMNLMGSYAADAAVQDTLKGRLAAERMLLKSVANVEVMWNGRIEFVSFPLPKATEFLSDASKEKFLESVDLSTHEKRMKELIRAEPSFTAEMLQVYVLAKKSWFYRLMHKHFFTIKLIQYALVLLLNLNVVMTGYGDDKESENGGKTEEGYTSAYRAAFVDGLQPKYRLSLALTFILGVPNFIGYLFIMGYVAITEVPIVVRNIETLLRDKQMEVATGQDVAYRDFNAFRWWGVSLIFNVVFILLHVAAYPGAEQPLLYSFLIFGINLPWTLFCVRNYILVPNTPHTRYYAIVFDSLVTHPFLRNQMILVFCSVNGFRFSSYFTLMLLDVANISVTVQSLVKSITKPAPQLGIVAYLFIIMVVIFASFGLEYFEPYFHYDMDYEDDTDDGTRPNPYGCHSVVACFWLILYKGVPGGTMDEVLDFVTNRDPLYLGRVFYDLLFFVVFGVFLFNVITGLIVDTFSSIREETQARENQLHNECYVCGFTRTTYDDIGMLNPTFDQHKSKNHYIWNYLYFIQYIQSKDQTDFSGVESYVYDMLQLKSLDWLPARTSFATQNYDLADRKEDANKESERRLMMRMEVAFDSMGKKIGDMASQIDRMEKRVANEMEGLQNQLEQTIKIAKGSKF